MRVRITSKIIITGCKLWRRKHQRCHSPSELCQSAQHKGSNVHSLKASLVHRHCSSTPNSHGTPLTLTNSNYPRTWNTHCLLSNWTLLLMPNYFQTAYWRSVLCAKHIPHQTHFTLRWNTLIFNWLMTKASAQQRLWTLLVSPMMCWFQKITS